tara:strand:- start:1295 stop:1636 length:342 start_codon:yes stop_codon:yes gene_type:complete
METNHLIKESIKSTISGAIQGAEIGAAIEGVGAIPGAVVGGWFGSKQENNEFQKMKRIIKKKKTVMKKKSMMKENSNLPNFIKAIAEKNYSIASKYLSQEIEAKLKNRISANI